MFNLSAREHFAAANGWRCSKSHFTIDALINGKYSGGRDREAGLRRWRDDVRSW
jgi:hypothetical protein